MDKINFVNNSAPDLSAETLNQMQNNIEEAIEEKHAYSTEEREVGTWIDEKPLYRKVVSVNTPSSSPVRIGQIANLETLVYGCILFQHEGGTFCTPNSVYAFGENVDIEHNKLPTASNIKVILEYTKTTDA